MRKAWTDPSLPYSYSGLNKIHHYLKDDKKLSEIKEEMNDVATYTLHKERKPIKKFNPFFIYYKNQMWQADLVYLPNFINENEGNKYLMCVLEVFTRKLYVKLMKNKDKKTALEAFSSLHTFINENPEILYTDIGGEFTSKEFSQYLKNNGIKHVLALNDTKAAHVERAQRSLQSILYRMMEEKQTNKYLDLIPLSVDIYNNRINRTTGFSPNDASLKENEEKVRLNLEKYYSRYGFKKKKPLFQVGDEVRLANKKTKFERGYHPKFTEEVFKIRKVLTNLPQTRYAVQSFTNEKIKGTFYERELTKARHREYKIEKILKTRKRGKKIEHYIKWLGYPESENSWVQDSDIKNY